MIEKWVWDEITTLDHYWRYPSRDCLRHHQRWPIYDDYSIVSSWLDLCNALYYILSSVNLAKLQRDQNTLARVVHSKLKYEQITTDLVHLHWLAIKPVASKVFLEKGGRRNLAWRRQKFFLLPPLEILQGGRFPCGSCVMAMALNQITYPLYNIH